MTQEKLEEQALLAAALDPYDKMEYTHWRDDAIDLLMEKALEAACEAEDTRRATCQHKLKLIVVLEGTEDEINDGYDLVENLDCPAIKCVYEGDYL